MIRGVIIVTATCALTVVLLGITFGLLFESPAVGFAVVTSFAVAYSGLMLRSYLRSGKEEDVRPEQGR